MPAESQIRGWCSWPSSVAPRPSSSRRPRPEAVSSRQCDTTRPPQYQQVRHIFTLSSGIFGQIVFKPPAAATPPTSSNNLHALTHRPLTRPAAVDGTNSEPEGGSSLSKATSVDRHGFLQRIGVAAAAGVLGSSSTIAPSTLPPSALAIGDLPEWVPDQRFTQHLVINVPDMAAALAFYINGLQMQVLRSRIVGGQNSTFVGFGPETLTTPGDWYPGVSSFGVYGAHFALELNEVPKAGEVCMWRWGRRGWKKGRGWMVRASV